MSAKYPSTAPSGGGVIYVGFSSHVIRMALAVQFSWRCHCYWINTQPKYMVGDGSDARFSTPYGGNLGGLGKSKNAIGVG